jgi:hypothetical protein
MFRRMRKEEVRSDIRCEMDDNTYLFDTTNLLDAKFPFKEQAKIVFQRLRQEGWFSDGEWKNTPATSAHESQHYDFLANLAEAIRNTYLDLFIERSLELYTKWIAVDRATPRPLRKFAPAIRPGILSVMTFNKEGGPWNELESKIGSQVLTIFFSANSRITLGLQWAGRGKGLVTYNSSFPAVVK